MKHINTLYLLCSSTFACLLALTPAWALNAHTDDSSGQQLIYIEPGNTHEACLELTPAQQLHYDFSTTGGKLAFNIHYHAGHKVFYPVAEHLTSQESADFIPESGQHYCLMWTNQGSSAVDLTLQQDVQTRAEKRGSSPD